MSQKILVLPAAGLATRLGGLPKFALPIGPHSDSLLGLHVKAGLHAGARVAVATRPLWVGLVEEILSGLKVDVCDLTTSTGSETVLRLLDGSPHDSLAAVSLPDTWIPSIEHDLSALFDSLAEVDNTHAAVAVTYVSRPEQVGRLGSCLVEDGYLKAVRDKALLPGSQLHWGMIGARVETWREYLDEASSHAGFILNALLREECEVKSVDGLSGYHDCGTAAGYLRALEESLGNE